MTAWPREWHRPFLGGWAMVALYAVPGVAYVFVTWAVIRRGDALATVAFAALSGGLFAWTAVVWPRYRGRPVPLGGAVALPFSRPRIVARVAAPVCAGTTLVAVGVTDEAMLVGLGAATVLVGVPWTLWRNPWDAAVVVSPDGIELVRGHRTGFVAWEDGLELVPFDDLTVGRGINFHHPAVRVYRAGADGRRRAAFDVPADRLAVHPLAAYALLRRYADDPAARAELAYS